jgi:hypothetical protein
LGGGGAITAAICGARDFGAVDFDAGLGGRRFAALGAADRSGAG